MSTKIFLAGASGAIGRRLVPLLTAAGYEVFGLTRDAAKAAELAARGARPVVADVYDAAALRAALVEAKPQIVIHQLTDLPQSIEQRGDPAALERNARVRVEGTKNLVDAALAAGATHMIAQSIVFAYAAGPEPHGEDDPLDASRGSVITLERLVLQSPPLAGCVLRFGTFYGPGTWYAEADGNMPVHVAAAARATLLAVQRGATGVFNVAEERGYARAERAHAELGWSPGLR